MRSRRSDQEPTVAGIEDLSVKFVSAANAVRYAVAYMEMALAAPRFKVSVYSRARLEMRNHLPYRLHITETSCEDAVDPTRAHRSSTDRHRIQAGETLRQRI